MLISQPTLNQGFHLIWWTFELCFAPDPFPQQANINDIYHRTGHRLGVQWRTKNGRNQMAFPFSHVNNWRDNCDSLTLVLDWLANAYGRGFSDPSCPILWSPIFRCGCIAPAHCHRVRSPNLADERDPVWHPCSQNARVGGWVPQKDKGNTEVSRLYKVSIIVDCLWLLCQ